MDLEPGTTIREVKQLAQENCNIEPEHMRLLHNDRVLKDADVLGAVVTESGAPIQIMFTAGHTALLGGGKPPPQPQRNPFSQPVRDIPGSKGERASRMSGRHGGMGLIRKYGIMMKRQEFREKAEGLDSGSTAEGSPSGMSLDLLAAMW